MKVLFKDKIKSYLITVALGMLAGFSVVFFCEFPNNDLWAFSYWSSETFGFWMFSTSLVVLFSEKRKCAAINAGVYIFIMFFITTVYKSLRLFWNGYTPFVSIAEVTVNSISGWLLYSIPAALVCAVLGLVLWSGRSNTLWGKILKILPAVFIFIETLSLFFMVFTQQTKLFSALTDLACLVGYVCIYYTSMRTIENLNEKGKDNNETNKA